MAANAAPPVRLSTRRFSVASCQNLFEVDGHVEEAGFDFLAPVARKNIIIQEYGSHVHSADGAGSTPAIDSALQNNQNSMYYLLVISVI